MKCRFCDHDLKHIFLDLGHTPISNDFLTHEELNNSEIFYPLKTYICEKCLLVQIGEYKFAKEIFNDKYIYFSSYSNSWLEHSRKYVDMITEKLHLNKTSFVVEIASNDGYLLQYFKKKSIPCLGIEPTKNTANVAISKGIDVITDFFSEKLASKLAKENKKADLIIGNNVFAHVPNINDFVKGLKLLLKPNGCITLEFPHLMQLIEKNQFDTIYHEHFSYFSFYTVKKIFSEHGLDVFDVEELATHGGSLRLYAKLKNNKTVSISKNVLELEEKEKKANLDNLDYYLGFQSKIEKLKIDILSFLLEQKKNNKKIIAYGAAAKGNTLINYCSIKKDLLPFVVDISPHKQNKFLPGSRIQVVNKDILQELKPNYIIILPWNLKEEISDQLSFVRKWGAKFITFIPTLERF